MLLGLLIAAMSGCVQKAPPELLQAVEAIDAQLVAVQGAEFAPDEYAAFAQHWMAFKGRLQSDDEEIGWPWEGNPFAADLRQLHEEGVRAASTALQRKEAERLAAEQDLGALEERLHTFTMQLDAMGTRLVLGKRPVETELLARQARSYMEQGHYGRAVRVAHEATGLLDGQSATLAHELGRYADAENVDVWQRMVRRSVEWSRAHQAAAIVVSKADRRLTLYRSGRAVLSYPVRLGYNGMLEKRYQGDGATPEGTYRVIRKRDRGQTQFYRALLLDYPNADDRRRFVRARADGRLPASAQIGGQIEIHGENNPMLSLTLGCVMLSNPEMDRLFADVDVGTPVTIVGALTRSNSVAESLASLAPHSRES